ncbi:MAG: non-canonical purine NTP pyrophosphatase [Gemmatimonadales bacterium]
MASRNAGKVAEFRGLLAPLGVEVRSPEECGLPEHPDEERLETAHTFAENAALKAEWFAARSGLVTLADDSGLEVDALSGAPGVFSKRFAGLDGPDHLVTAANNAALLAAMRDVPDAARSARYRCVLVLHRPVGAEWPWAEPAEGASLVVAGVTEGRILKEPEGEGGFGYDPLFWSDDLGMSFGQASREAKGKISHRGRAVHELIERVHPRRVRTVRDPNRG